MGKVMQNIIIEIVRIDGQKSFLHNSGNDLFWSCQFNSAEIGDLTVELTDYGCNSVNFNFSVSAVGHIYSGCISSNTAFFVRKIIEHGSCAFIESSMIKEIIDGTDISITQMILNENSLNGETYFLRLTEKQDDLWILSFVFCTMEVKSEPLHWPDIKLESINLGLPDFPPILP